jgi:choline dehydrogenase
VAALPVNCLDGRRISTAIAYLEPARGRANLTIRANCLVQDVVFQDHRVAGLRVHGTGEVIETGEVIVCGGAYQSPGLLIRSGIGPATDLAALGVPIVVNLPGVGANLADHPAVSIDLPCGPPEGDPAIFQMAATTRSGHSQGAAPDLQLMICGPYATDGGHACSLAAALLRPMSLGRLRLSSPDAAAPPDIDLGYFRDPSDAIRLRVALRLADAATQAKPLASQTGATRFGPPREVVGDDAAALAWIRASAWTYHHPVGTCAMGLDPAAGAVVDPTGRVYGVSGLSVVDASVMPDIPSANTNIPTIMLAEHVTTLRRAGAMAGTASCSRPPCCSVPSRSV